MNLGQIRSEVQARGFDYLLTARCNTLINIAVNEICSYMPWPFMETSVGPSASPLTITDLGWILSVVDSLQDTRLSPADRRYVLNQDADLTDTGTPQVYWTEGNTVTVWPGSATDTITVRYVKTPVDLSSDSDVPLIPTGFHDLIVHGTVLQAQLDNDMLQSYQMTRQVWQTRIDQMVQAIMGRDLGGPVLMTVTDPRDF
jgi:hypothetical protein